MEKYLYANEEIENGEEAQEEHIIFGATAVSIPRAGLIQAREILYGDENEAPRPTDDLNCGKLSKLASYIIKGGITMSAWFCYAEALASKA